MASTSSTTTTTAATTTARPRLRTLHAKTSPFPPAAARPAYVVLTLSPSDPAFQYLCFQNFYCAAISVKQRLPAAAAVPVASSSGTTALSAALASSSLASSTSSPSSSLGPTASKSKSKHVWKRVFERKLMASPHHENDAQDWHTIHVDEFGPAFAPASLTVLRIYLEQPSPQWARHELRHVQLLCHDDAPGGGGGSGGAGDGAGNRAGVGVGGGRSGSSVSSGGSGHGRGSGRGGGGIEASSSKGCGRSGSSGATGAGRRGGGGGSQRRPDLSRRLEGLWNTARQAEQQLAQFRESSSISSNPLQSLLRGTSSNRSAVEVVLSRH